MGRPFSVPASDRFRATAWRFGGYRTKHVGFVVTFQRRRRGDRTQREAGPFGVTPPSYPRRHGERRDACEPSGPTSVSVNASCARGPDNPRVSPIGGGLGRLPTMPPIGFSCALKGSCCQQRGPAARYTAQQTRPAQPLQPHFRENTCPARHQTPAFGHCEHAGRTISCPHPHQAEQGDKYRAQHAETWRH